ncbi:MAG: hypothetical protein ABF683_06860 [Sporolactobacillus sp.]
MSREKVQPNLPNQHQNSSKVPQKPGKVQPNSHIFQPNGAKVQPNPGKVQPNRTKNRSSTGSSTECARIAIFAT